MRVFLSETVWLDDPPGFRQRLGQFLETARKHGLSVMLVLFSDGEYVGHVGPQPDPIPGVHNSRAAVAPGFRVALDPQQWSPLKAYVRDIVGSFSDDKRIRRFSNGKPTPAEGARVGFQHEAYRSDYFAVAASDV